MLLETQNERHSTELADLRGVRLTVCTEVPAGHAWNEPLIKQLTGSDRIRARKLYQNHEEFDPTHKIIVLGNYRPRLKGADLGIRRRLKLIPFERTFTEGRRDPHLLDKLLAELPGILAWAVEGCRLWQRDGLGTSRRVTEATSSYMDEGDLLGPFLIERCTVTEAAKVTRAAVYATFADWMTGQGYDHAPSPQAFAELMRCRGFGECTLRVAGRQQRAWHGVGLASDSTDSSLFGVSGNFSATQPHEREVPGSGARAAITAINAPSLMDDDNEVVS
jgi:putative DNA primase/helicase